MSKSYTHFKRLNPDAVTNAEYAKDLRARIDDLNELLEQAPQRDVLVHMKQWTVVSSNAPSLELTLSERL